ncbi:MAG: hypothetical protein Ct9H300mP1_03690 [Planctomycetaceae bacterium]|nr:MAG: hypothetical protein Ct9H300mP1_03690 [Planctomycetaceae bacterium]
MDPDVGCRDRAERAVLEDHKSEVYCLAFSPPTARRGPSGSANNSSVVNSGTSPGGNEQIELTGHGNVVHALGWSPDGAGWPAADTTGWSASGSQRTTRIAALQATLGGYNHKLYSVQFTSDGQQLLTAQADKVTRNWNGRLGRNRSQALPRKGHRGPKAATVVSVEPGWVHATAFSPEAACWPAGTEGISPIAAWWGPVKSATSPAVVSSPNCSATGTSCIHSPSAPTARNWRPEAGTGR